MKKTLITCILVAILGITGCTTAQVKQVENDVHKAVVVAQKVIAAYEANTSKISDVEAALIVLNALAPQSGVTHDAIDNALKAIQALKNNQGTIDDVKQALLTVEILTSPFGG